jgi:hypothetical protein
MPQTIEEIRKSLEEYSGMGVDCIVNEDDVRFLLAHIQAQRETMEEMVKVVTREQNYWEPTPDEPKSTWLAIERIRCSILAAFTNLREKNKV